MNVNIHGVHFDLTPGLRRFIMENLYEPLLKIWNSEATDLDVYLRDLHGPKGGVDKECRCVLHVPMGPQIVITEITTDMRMSIHQAKKRLVRRARDYYSQKIEAPRRLRQQSRLTPNQFEEVKSGTGESNPDHAEAGENASYTS